MATITPVVDTAAGTAVTFAAATAGGDTVATGGNTSTKFTVRNASGSAVTTTIAGVVPCSQGAVHNTVVSCTAGVDTQIIIPPQCISPTTGNAGITYSAVTSVTVAAFI